MAELNNELKELLKDYNEIEKLLKSRVQERGMDFYIPNPMQLRMHKSKAKIIAYTGGNRCVGGETKLYNPVSKEIKRIDEIKDSFFVYAWNGEKLVVTRAYTPFVKSFGQLFRVTLSNGKQIVASSAHRLLTPRGFVSISKLHKGSTVCVPFSSQSELNISLETLPQHHDEREDGGQLPIEASRIQHKDSAIRFLLSYDDINQDSHFQSISYGSQKAVFSHPHSNLGICLSTLVSNAGYCEKKELNSQSYYHHEYYLNDALPHQVKETCQVSSPLQGGVHEYNDSYDEGVLNYTPKYNRFCQLVSHPSIVDVYRHYYNFVLPDDIYAPSETSFVSSIEYVRDDFIYDFTVPLYHNYQDLSTMVSSNSGKSSAGSLEVCWAVTKKYPEWFPKERRFNRPVKIRIATDKFFKIDSVIEPKIRSYLPANEITQVRRSPQGYINKLHTKDGSFVEFLTMEQDEMAFEGQDLDLFWGDEPVERRRYVATQRGLIDRSGQTILTFTPLIEPWMKEEIVDKADGKKIEVINADIRDNRFDIEGNPILREEDIQKFEDMLTDDEKETRLHGKFFHLKGVVYKELCEQHLIDAFKYEIGYPVICVLDPHDRLPHHLIWAMIDRMNDIYVMYELVREGTIQELAASIKATEKFYGWNVMKRLIDPNFGRKPLLSTGLSVIDELYKYKCSFSEANDSKEAGHLKVKELLHFNRNKPIDIQNKPKLFFVRDSVPKTIHSMMNYQYDEWRGNIDKDPKEEGKQKDCHGADVIRYLVLSNPQFVMPRPYEPQLQEAYY